MSGPSQPVTLNEEWSEERIKSWLQVRPYDDTPVDYFILLRAYEAMPVEYFERFLGYFVEAGHDINGRNAEGQTILDRVSQHAQAAVFQDMLRRHGAKLASEL